MYKLKITDESPEYESMKKLILSTPESVAVHMRYGDFATDEEGSKSLPLRYQEK